MPFNEELLKQIQENDPTITAITISESDFNNENLIKLAQALERNFFVQSIQVNNKSPWGQSAIAAFKNIFQNNCTLVEISGNSPLVLAESLARNQDLQRQVEQIKQLLTKLSEKIHLAPPDRIESMVASFSKTYAKERDKFVQLLKDTALESSTFDNSDLNLIMHHCENGETDTIVRAFISQINTENTKEHPLSKLLYLCDNLQIILTPSAIFSVIKDAIEVTKDTKLDLDGLKQKWEELNRNRKISMFLVDRYDLETLPKLLSSKEGLGLFATDFIPKNPNGFAMGMSLLNTVGTNHWFFRPLIHSLGVAAFAGAPADEAPEDRHQRLVLAAALILKTYSINQQGLLIEPTQILATLLEIPGIYQGNFEDLRRDYGDQYVDIMVEVDAMQRQLGFFPIESKTAWFELALPEDANIKSRSTSVSMQECDANPTAVYLSSWPGSSDSYWLQTKNAGDIILKKTPHSDARSAYTCHYLHDALVNNWQAPVPLDRLPESIQKSLADLNSGLTWLNEKKPLNSPCCYDDKQYSDHLFSSEAKLQDGGYNYRVLFVSSGSGPQSVNILPFGEKLSLSITHVPSKYLSSVLDKDNRFDPKNNKVNRENKEAYILLINPTNPKSFQDAIANFMNLQYVGSLNRSPIIVAIQKTDIPQQEWPIHKSDIIEFVTRHNLPLREFSSSFTPQALDKELAADYQNFLDFRSDAIALVDEQLSVLAGSKNSSSGFFSGSKAKQDREQKIESLHSFKADLCNGVSLDKAIQQVLSRFPSQGVQTLFRALSDNLKEMAKERSQTDLSSSAIAEIKNDNSPPSGV